MRPLALVIIIVLCPGCAQIQEWASAGMDYLGSSEGQAALENVASVSIASGNPWLVGAGLGLKGLLALLWFRSSRKAGKEAGVRDATERALRAVTATVDAMPDDKSSELKGAVEERLRRLGGENLLRAMDEVIDKSRGRI